MTTISINQSHTSPVDAIPSPTDSIIRHGPVARAQRIVLYGSSGVGKTTLAANSPRKSLFVDSEDGTTHLDVLRVTCRSLEQLGIITRTLFPASLYREGVRTLVIDTIDGIENFLREKIVCKYRVESIGQIRYGNGFIFWREEFNRFLNTCLDPVIAAGIHVVVVSHSTVRRQQPPGLREPFDRYEPKLDVANWRRLVEWSDSLLFYTFDLRLSITGEGRPIGLGGKQRYLYTQYSPAWEAKCRIAVPERIEVPNDLAELDRIFAPFFCDYRKETPQQRLAETIHDLNQQDALAFLRSKSWLQDGQGIESLSDRVTNYLLSNIAELRTRVTQRSDSSNEPQDTTAL
jgi:AAA domain-containing protein